MAAKPRTHTTEAILEETVLSAPGSDAMTTGTTTAGSATSHRIAKAR